MLLIFPFGHTNTLILCSFHFVCVCAKSRPHRHYLQRLARASHFTKYFIEATQPYYDKKLISIKVDKCIDRVIVDLIQVNAKNYE